MKAGERFPVFQLDFARIGIMICYDGYFAECPASLSLQGAEIIIWINGRESVVQDYMVKTDVWRNYCAMIATNFAAGGGIYIAS
jgi:predicted amidohydrolase